MRKGRREERGEISSGRNAEPRGPSQGQHTRGREGDPGGARAEERFHRSNRSLLSVE